MDDQEIRSRLNEPNQQLLQEIESNMLPVWFEEWGESHYAAKISKSQDRGIVYCMPDLQQAKIAHELLHIKTGFSLGDDNVMLVMARQSCNPLVMMVITEDLCEGLLNQAEHYLFFEDYLKMGYNATDFFEELRLQTAAEQWKDKIIKHGIGNNGTYTTTEIYSYLAVLILFLLYPVKGQYKSQFKKVSKAIPELSSTMEKFVGKLQAINPEARERGRMQTAYEVLTNDIIRFICNTRIIPSLD